MTTQITSSMMEGDADASSSGLMRTRDVDIMDTTGGTNDGYLTFDLQTVLRHARRFERCRGFSVTSGGNIKLLGGTVRVCHSDHDRMWIDETIEKTSASWAIGDGFGGRVGATRDRATAHIYSIYRSSDGAMDAILIDAGETIAASMPAGWDCYSFVGAVSMLFSTIRGQKLFADHVYPDFAGVAGLSGFSGGDYYYTASDYMAGGMVGGEAYGALAISMNSATAEADLVSFTTCTPDPVATTTNYDFVVEVADSQHNNHWQSYCFWPITDTIVRGRKSLGIEFHGAPNADNRTWWMYFSGYSTHMERVGNATDGPVDDIT